MTIPDPKLIARIQNDFTYHRPPTEVQSIFVALREQAKLLAELFATHVPAGREQSTALTRLEEAVMHANAGLARQYPVEQVPKAPPSEPPAKPWTDGRVSTTDGNPPAQGLEYGKAPAPQPVGPNGQNGAYFVLSDEERLKGFLAPVRDSYVHAKCGALTSMGRALAETYARDPSFYGTSFCCGCGNHFPVAEFTWDGTDILVGSMPR